MGKQEVMTAAEFQAKYGQKKFVIPPVKTGVKKGRSSNSESIVKDSIEVGPGWCRITLVGVIHGLNGKKGLRFQHWTINNKVKEEFVIRVMALRPPKFPGKVRITFTRFATRLMDSDNLWSTQKFPMDALKTNGVIKDDSPDYVIPVLPNQVKCRQKDQKTCIFIEEVTPIH